MKTQPPIFDGTHFEIGQALGLHFRAASTSLTASAAWREIQACYSSRQLQEWIARVRAVFPELLEEVEGIASGMGVDADALFLWNCRPNMAARPMRPSCTIAINRLGSRFAIYAQQYGSATHEQPTLVEINPSGQPAFVCTYLPGTLPGLGAAASRSGVVQIATCHAGEMPSEELPAAFLARAVLGADSLASALDIVMQCPPSGRDHHILASHSEFMMVTVEGRAGERTLIPISNKVLCQNDARAAHGSRFDGLVNLYEKLPHHPGDDELLQLWQEYRLTTPASQVQAVFFSISKDCIDLYLHEGPTVQSYVRIAPSSFQ